MFQKMKESGKRFGGRVMGFGAGLGTLLAGKPAFAAITMPTLPTTDLETAIGAVLALVAVAVVGGLIVRSIKKA